MQNLTILALALPEISFGGLKSESGLHDPDHTPVKGDLSAKT